MIELSARDFGAFTAVFRHFHLNGVEVMATGGNRGTVPDDTPWPLVEAAAGMDGVEVYTDLPAPAPPEPEPEPGTEPSAPTKATKTAATKAARRTRKPSTAPADTGV